MEKTNLFFLPFAGGSKYSYRKYEANQPPFFNFIPLEYPGRGSRVTEPFAADVHVLVDDLYHRICHFLDKERYGIYGHSMGGVVAYLLTRVILANGHRPPEHVFITGTAGPSVASRKERNYHLLDKAEFLEKVRDLDGLPEEIFQDSELLDFIEPILRADFRISETYVHEEEAPMEIPFTVITGMDEDIAPEDIQLWQNCSRHKVDFRRMKGGHFFIFQYIDTIINILSMKMLAPKKNINYE